METDLNKIKGVFIPTKVMRDKKLSLREVYIYSLVLTLDRENDFKGVGLTNEQFSEFLNLSKRQLSDALGNLEKIGYITIIIAKEQGNKRRIYSGKIIKN
jgi:predicted transcriptional regulator